jgi:hypothetical protein
LSSVNCTNNTGVIIYVPRKQNKTYKRGSKDKAGKKRRFAFGVGKIWIAQHLLKRKFCCLLLEKLRNFIHEKM